MPNPTDGEHTEDQDVKQQPAGASDAGGEGGKEPSMLEAMQAAMQTEEGSPSSPEQDPDTDPANPEDAETQPGADDEPTEDELKGFGQGAQRRIKQLVDQRRSAVAERDTFAQKASGFDKIVSYMAEHRLTNDDVDRGFYLMSLVRNDPMKALQELEPVVRQLQQMTGHDLDDDLRERVRLGYMRERDAKELSQQRAQARLSTTRQSEMDEMQRRREHEQRIGGQMQAATRAADGWYAEQSAKDPDFSMKQTRIGELVELELRRTNGLPDPSKVAGMLDGIKKTVDAEFRRFRPRPEAITPVNGNASPSSKPEPTTMLEAMKQAI